MRSVRGTGEAWWNLKAKRKPARKKMKCYQQRTERLSTVGYANYQEYLASDDWRAIRERKLRRHPYCLLCQAVACQVHHMDYHCGTLLGLRDHRLVTLCDKCHEGIELARDSLPARFACVHRRIERAGLTAIGQRWIRHVEYMAGLAKAKQRKLKRERRAKRS